jgi:hypothetical protein
LKNPNNTLFTRSQTAAVSTIVAVSTTAIDKSSSVPLSIWSNQQQQEEEEEEEEANSIGSPYSLIITYSIVFTVNHK